MSYSSMIATLLLRCNIHLQNATITQVNEHLKLVTKIRDDFNFSSFNHLIKYCVNESALESITFNTLWSSKLCFVIIHPCSLI